MDSIANIREKFVKALRNQEFVNGTIEIVNANFKADSQTIFGAPNQDYIERELDWYLSKSLSINDIPGGAPKIWKQVASTKGKINSNYGYLAISSNNGSQLKQVIEHLIADQNTRRATMIYTRPSIHDDWNRDGMSDFICTNTVQYLIRDNQLHVVVQMRSNDAIFGYRNDYAWQKYMQQTVIECLLENEIKVYPGDIYWNVASLHIYERHYKLIELYDETGIWNANL